MGYRFDRKTAGVVAAADYLEYVRGGKPLRHPELGVSFYGLRECLCFGSGTQAVAAVSKTGDVVCLFKESCPYISNEQTLPDIVQNHLDVEVVDIDEAVPLFPPGADNLWHWTLESMSRLMVLEHMGYTGPYIVQSKTLADPQCMAMQTLALMGIGKERLLPSGPTYRIRRMMLPERVSGFELPYNMALVAFIRDNLLERVGQLEGSRRLYIQRIGRRRVLNEDELFEVLDDYGFETMTPEKMTVREQWRALTNVECSFMAHGANTTLTLLQKPRTGMVELFSNRYVIFSNMHAMRLLKLRYYPLAEELNVACYPNEKGTVFDFLLGGIPADITIDPMHVRIALDSLLAN